MKIGECSNSDPEGSPKYVSQKSEAIQKTQRRIIMRESGRSSDIRDVFLGPTCLANELGSSVAVKVIARKFQMVLAIYLMKKRSLFIPSYGTSRDTGITNLNE